MHKLYLTIILCSLISFAYSQNALNLYGGEDHKEYLGCLNCNKFDSNSIWNAYGSYGSRYNSNSIWNKYGIYGGQYSSYSPFNANAEYPPVIVDENGGFYGYLTTNKYNSKRANSKLALTIYQYWDLIEDDVSAWYDKLFG